MRNSQKDFRSKERKLEAAKNNLVKESVKSPQIKSKPKDVSKINQDKFNLAKESNVKTKPTKWVVKKKQIEVLNKNNISKKALSPDSSPKVKNIEVMQVSLVVENPPERKSHTSIVSWIENSENDKMMKSKDASKQQKENHNLVIVNELTGEDTTSTKSFNKLDTSENANSRDGKHEYSKKSWDFRSSIVSSDRVDSINNFTINSPLVRDEVEDLDEFVKNITINWKNHSESESEQNSDDFGLDEIKEIEENVLEVEYYGLNKSNISKESLLHSGRKNNLSYLDQLDLESKRSKADTSNHHGSNNHLNLRKDHSSSSILDLYKGDMQSESSSCKIVDYQFKRDTNISGIKIGCLDSLDSESNNYSLEISGSQQFHTHRKFDYSSRKEELGIKGIHDLLVARHHKRKHSLQELSCNLIKRSQDIKQQTEDEVDDEELFKISWDKTSENSIIFNLNNSRTKEHKSTFSRAIRGDGSDVWKDECSTLKEYSNLHSSKVYSISEISKPQQSSKNCGTREVWKCTSKPLKSYSNLSNPCWKPQNIEPTEELFWGWGK